jgi:tetratricopeptide (TPR) repeat protein
MKRVRPAKRPVERQPRHGLHRQRRWRVTAALLALVLLGIGWWNWPRRPTAPIPELSLQEAAPAVADAVAQARRRVVEEPRSASAWGEFGMLLFAHQFEFEANTCLAQAAELDPNDFRWPYLLGISLSVSEPRIAAGHFRRALALRSDFPAAHLRLGELLLLSEEFTEASQHFEAAHQAELNEPRTHYNMARLLVAQGDPAKARPWAEQAAKLAPDTKSVHELLAMILQRLGDRAAAAEEIKRAEHATALMLGWNDPVASGVGALRQDAASLFEHANALLNAGQSQQAVNVLLQALRADDRDPRIYTTLARTLINANQLNEASDVLSQAEQRHPQVAEIHFQRGNIEFLTQHLESAEKSFRRAVELQPGLALAHYNLGHVQLKRNQPTEALESFTTATRLRPDHTDSHINAAKLLLQQGDSEKAATHLRHAARFKPGDRQIQELLDQAARQ